MRFIEHHLYLIRNPVTQQSQYFEPFEVLEYKSQYILYGELRHDEVKIFLGPLGTIEKPVAFPIFPHASNQAVVEFCQACDGALLGISEAPSIITANIKAVYGEEILVPNCSHELAHVWGGDPWLTAPKRPNRDGLVRKCQKQVDAFLEWQLQLRWPHWFQRDRGNARAIGNKN